jgi:hypothetical protein
MPIRWNPKEVRQALDRIEALLNEAMPHLEAANKEGTRATAIPNLPEYMRQPLANMSEELKFAVARCHKRIEQARERIPDRPPSRAPVTGGPTLF